MAEYEKKVREMLKSNGCTFVRHGKGDHDIWYIPISKVNFPVDGRIKSRHVVKWHRASVLSSLASICFN
jgi:hypothetical protein